MSRTAYDDFLTAVILGLVPGYRADNKFGRNPSIGSTRETVWDAGGLYQYLAPGVSGPVEITSDDIADAGKNIQIIGLNSSYIEQSEILQLDATDPTTTPVTSTLSYHRQFRTIMSIPDINVGNITVTSTAGATPVMSQITAGEGQSLMALFTVPAGKTVYIPKGLATIEGQKIGTIYAQTRTPGNDFATRRVYDVSAGPPANVFVESVLEEKTDYELRAVTDVSASPISATVFYIVIDNDRLIGKN